MFSHNQVYWLDQRHGMAYHNKSHKYMKVK